jgi:uncharacterized protein YciI
MKYHKITCLVICFTCITILSSAQDGQDKKPENRIKQYWFVMLLKGPNRNQDSTEAAKIQEGHMANITRLYNEGKLKVAGPFGDDGNWLGIFIFDIPSKEEVEKNLKTDPAISSGRLSYDIRPWYTSPTGSFTPGKPKM